MQGQAVAGVRHNEWGLSEEGMVTDASRGLLYWVVRRERGEEG